MLNRKPHTACCPGCENVAKITCWHRERNLTIWGTKSKSSLDVIGDLCCNTCPIDRVHSRKVQFLTEWKIGKKCFDKVLAIIKCAFNGKIGDMRRDDGGHLASLYFGCTSFRVEDNNRESLTAATSFDSGRSCITRCCPNNSGILIALCEDVIKQEGKKLKSNILKSKGRTMKKLLHKKSMVYLC